MAYCEGLLSKRNTPNKSKKRIQAHISASLATADKKGQIYAHILLDLVGLVRPGPGLLLVARVEVHPAKHLIVRPVPVLPAVAALVLVAPTLRGVLAGPLPRPRLEVPSDESQACGIIGLSAKW